MPETVLDTLNSRCYLQSLRERNSYEKSVFEDPSQQVAELQYQPRSDKLQGQSLSAIVSFKESGSLLLQKLKSLRATERQDWISPAAQWTSLD